MKRILKTALDRAMSASARRVELARRLGTYMARALAYDGYHDLRSRFMQNGGLGRGSRQDRAELVRSFEIIDSRIPISSTPSEGLHLAEAMLCLEAEGAVVECGCFAGGSTAKLSLVAALTGRKLHVFDSFEGLPEVDEFNRSDCNARWGAEFVTDWDAGRYAAPLESVQKNVERMGDLSVCTFTKGWFSDTLRADGLPSRIAMAFVDVDVPVSARECLVALWPLLKERGIYFQHDVGFIKLLQAVLDEELWREQLREFPPVLFGAGYGLGDDAPYLGYFVKGKAVPADYINALTIKK